MGDGCISFCSAQEEQGERVLLRASVAFAILALFLFDSRLGSRMADESKVNVLDGVEAAMRFREEEEKKKKEEEVKARSSESAGEQEDSLKGFLDERGAVVHRGQGSVGERGPRDFPQQWHRGARLCPNAWPIVNILYVRRRNHWH